MQTQSHALITAALMIPLRHRRVHRHVPAAVFGAILPDIPFFLLTLAGEIYYRWFAPLPALPGITTATATTTTATTVMEYLHFTLFFHDPLWIVSHNLFHSLLIDTLLLCLGFWGMRCEKRWGATLLWLSASMLLHVGIDIVTHQSDGPLIWFPLNWSYRFASPVSYWESAYWGRVFLVFEYTLDLMLIVLLLVTYRPFVQGYWHWLLGKLSRPPRPRAPE